MVWSQRPWQKLCKDVPSGYRTWRKSKRTAKEEVGGQLIGRASALLRTRAADCREGWRGLEPSSYFR